MKIQIVKDVNVAIEHGMRPGRVFEATEYKGSLTGRSRPRFTVVGDAGEEVSLYPREARVVEGHFNETPPEAERENDV